MFGDNMSLIKFTPPLDLYLTITDSGFTDKLS